MRIELSDRARRSYNDTPGSIYKTFDKQVLLLLADMRHPSLHAKKYDEARGVWQARINRNWRFYFVIHDDVYYIVDIMKHPK